MRALNRYGMNTIEFWSSHDKDLQKIKNTKDELGMEVASIVVKPESWVDPSNRDKALKALKETAKNANYLGTKLMVQTVGFEAEGLTRQEMHKSLSEGLRASIPILEEHKITIAIEPLNTKADAELKGYYLNTSEEAFEIVKNIHHPLVKVCYDIYHVQIMEGHVISRMLKNIQHIAHIQAAGTPGRHELFLGELNYDNIFDAIKQTDYSGYVEIEYFPIHNPIYDLAEIHKKHHTG
ncbi:TIM barrel protein [Bacillus massiliglaciei]|uniref:TIM barrel protein n=1 Tax=Bacillus massiliglaciei TaxID=1816693 RepID=UPI000DA6118F|nr:TIM barrel protein [Bacillus massiliglaciei]